MFTAKKKTVLIAGGGFAGGYAFLKLHAAYHKSEEVAIEMVSRENYFLFTPLLHEVATGGVSRDNILYNLRVILGCCLARFHRANIQQIDLSARTVHTSKGSLHYDVLIYALGSNAVLPHAAATRDARVVPLKRLEDAHNLKNGILNIFEQGEQPEFAVVGGGPTGVEIAAELNEFLKDICVLFPDERRRVRLSLVHAGERLLPTFHSELGERAKVYLEKKGVAVFLNEKIVHITPREAVTERGASIPTALTVWTTGVSAHKVPFLPEVPIDSKKRILVTDYLNLKAFPEVFIAGDAASPPLFGKRGGLPMTAQAAVASGNAAARNAIAFLKGGPLRPFRYRHQGDLFSLGHWMAGAEIGGFRFFGHLAWWLWRTIYLSKLIGLRNKVRVAADWTMNLFLPRDLNSY